MNRPIELLTVYSYGVAMSLFSGRFGVRVKYFAFSVVKCILNVALLIICINLHFAS